MKTSRVRTLFSLIWLVFTMSLVTWWFIFAIRNLNADDLTDSAKHYRMFFYEGSTLLVTVLFGGIVMIVLSYRDDMRNEKIKFFFSNFTHEIKTSITRIRLQADILIEEDTNKSNKILNRLLNDIAKLDLQLENSLLLSHVNEAKFLSETINFKEMIQSIQVEFEDLKLNIDRNATINADSRAFKSVIRNIFENARRHGKATEVHCQIKSLKDDLVQITIQDNGQGSSRQEKQLGNEILSTSANQGSGIGLYLSKQLIVKMHGQIFFKTPSASGFEVLLHLKGNLL